MARYRAFFIIDASSAQDFDAESAAHAMSQAEAYAGDPGFGQYDDAVDVGDVVSIRVTNAEDDFDTMERDL
jgi:hypothetical protein